MCVHLDKTKPRKIELQYRMCVRKYTYVKLRKYSLFCKVALEMPSSKNFYVYPHTTTFCSVAAKPMSHGKWKIVSFHSEKPNVKWKWKGLFLSISNLSFVCWQNVFLAVSMLKFLGFDWHVYSHITRDATHICPTDFICSSATFRSWRNTMHTMLKVGTDRANRKKKRIMYTVH